MLNRNGQPDDANTTVIIIIIIKLHCKYNRHTRARDRQGHWRHASSRPLPDKICDDVRAPAQHRGRSYILLNCWILWLYCHVIAWHCLRLLLLVSFVVSGGGAGEKKVNVYNIIAPLNKRRGRSDVAVLRKLKNNIITLFYWVFRLVDDRFDLRKRKKR